MTGSPVRKFDDTLSAVSVVKEAFGMNDMSDTVKDAIRDMPVHWDDDQQRTNYIVQHAKRFQARYKTQKTLVTSDWDDLESAKKAAAMVAGVGAKVGKMQSGVHVLAILGEGFEAVAESYFVVNKTVVTQKQLNGGTD